jgi:biotin carboxylase
MKKQVIFVESNTSGTGMLSFSITKGLGFDPVFITNDYKRYANSLDDIDCETLYVDTNSLENTLSFIKENFNVRNIHCFITTSDFYLEIVAKLNDFFNLRGNSFDTINICRNKDRLRLQLEKSEVKQPDFIIYNKYNDLDWCALKYPLVLKPVDDSGSNNVLLCKEESEVRKYLIYSNKSLKNVRNQFKSENILIEEYLDGKEYSVEMITIDGNSKCIGITEKFVKGDPYFVEYMHIFPAVVDEETSKKIINEVNKVLEIVGINYGVTHTEVKLTKEGPAIIEVNPRLAGGMIPEIIQHATGRNILKDHLKVLLGIDDEIKYYTNKWAGVRFLISEYKGLLKGIRGIVEVNNNNNVIKTVLTKKIGNKIEITKNAYGRLGFIVATEQSAISLKRLLNNCAEKINFNIESEENIR